MTLEVALAMLHRHGRWLMQLRDDIPGIVAPGRWGLFSGHLAPGETAEQALRRELLDEIGWQPAEVHHWLQQRNQRHLAHVFRVELTVPLEHPAAAAQTPGRWPAGGDAGGLSPANSAGVIGLSRELPAAQGLISLLLAASRVASRTALMQRWARRLASSWLRARVM